MGLLKSLLNMAVKAAADSLTQKLENQSTADEAPASPRFEPEPQPQREEITDWNAYFEDILKTDFPQYTLSRNVAVTDLAGNAADQFQKAAGLQIVFVEDGEFPVLCFAHEISFTGKDSAPGQVRSEKL